MRQSFYIIIVLLKISVTISAQQTTMWSNMELDQYLSNPAAAGFKKSLIIHSFYRNQWNGIEKGISTQSVVAHLPLYIIYGAVGGKLLRDVRGATQRVEMSLSYNYVMPSQFGLISMGSEISWLQVKLKGDQLITPTGDYRGGLVDHKDNHLPSENAIGSSAQVAFGGYLKRNNLEVGLVWRGGLQSSFNLSDPNFIYSNENVLTVHGGYWWKINDDYNFNSYLSVVGSKNLLQSLIGTNITLPNNMMTGVALRGYSKTTIDAIVLKGGLRLNKHFRLNYSYDYLISHLNEISTNNTHEFVLSYNLNKPIRTGLPPRIIYNPRY